MQQLKKAGQIICTAEIKLNGLFRPCMWELAICNGRQLHLWNIHSTQPALLPGASGGSTFGTYTLHSVPSYPKPPALSNNGPHMLISYILHGLSPPLKSPPLSRG